MRPDPANDPRAGGTRRERFWRTIAQASNGDFSLAGSPPSGIPPTTCCWFDGYRGNPKWRRVFGSDGESERAVRVAIAPDRDILVLATIGHAYDTFQQADYYLIRTDPSGEVRWERRFGGDYNDVAADMLLTGDGPLVLGTADLAGDGNFDMQLVQLDQDGNALWSAAYGGDGNERAIGLAPPVMAALRCWVNRRPLALAIRSWFSWRWTPRGPALEPVLRRDRGARCARHPAGSRRDSSWLTTNATPRTC